MKVNVVATVLALAALSCSSNGTAPGPADATLGDGPSGDAAPTGDAPADAAPVSFTLSFPNNEMALADYPARAKMGFRFGFVDGVMGAVTTQGQYTMFGSGQTWNDAGACPKSPGVQGAWRLGTSLTSFTTDYGCQALIQNDDDGGIPLSDGGVLGYFDRDYVGGGPVQRIASTDGTRTGILMVYHAEFHWGPRCPPGPGNAPCFYGTLGIALSTDDGATFTRLGEVIQPSVSRPEAVTAGYDISIGAGPFVAADANGHGVDDPNADPTHTYLYVFYPDTEQGVTCGGAGQCLAVARALYSDVTAFAFAPDPAKLPMLFTKYYNGSFGSEPGWKGDPNDAVNGGQYTPVIADGPAFSPTVLWDKAIGQFILAYQVNMNDIAFRTSVDLVHWSASLQTLTEPGYWLRYPSLIGDATNNPRIGTTQPWLFYSKFDLAHPDWQHAVFSNRRLLLTVTP